MIDLKNIAQDPASFLKEAYDKKQLAHSYLFVDTDEDQALSTAYWLACLYNCTGTNRPDGSCQNCQQILSGNFPDVLLVQTEGKQTLGIDQIRPLKEELAKSPVESSCRFFFIRQAERLTMPAANALLNLLEEPIAPVVSILITNNSDQILPTIRSRTQIINFENNDNNDSHKQILLNNGFSSEEIEELGDTDNIDQLVKYFYQEMLEFNNLSLISAYKIADYAKNNAMQNYVFFRLKRLAQKDLNNQSKMLLGTRMLKYLIEIDKMRFSNVNFRNSLDYLALQWKR